MKQDDFPISVRLRVAWGDLDAFGHVNNTMFFRYFEDARIACFERIGMQIHMAEVRHGPILAKTDCVFRQPIDFPDALTSCTRIVDLGSDRFTMEHALFSDKKGLVAHGSGRIVMLDYATGGKVPIPADVRAAIEAL
ncbi:MAG: acyl-CoA thioesterase [Myxococcales bacterium]|nr:acyl-CoA thioesterase [Myxococcales bacterium]